MRQVNDNDVELDANDVPVVKSKPAPPIPTAPNKTKRNVIAAVVAVVIAVLVFLSTK